MERTAIGKRIPRVDALDRVTGKAAFGADFHLAGMLYGKILRSPYPHARILSINVEKALQMEGVKAVVTGKDFPTIPYGTLAPQGDLNIDVWALSQVVIARDKVFFSGQPVAAVAATDLFIAEEALKLIKVEYQVLTPVIDVLEAMKPDAPLLHSSLYTQEFMGEKAKTPSNIALHIQLERGDVEAAFRESDVVMENTYRTQVVHQGYMEPEAAVVRMDSDGKITVWSTTQGSFSLKTQLSYLLQIPSPQIRVIPMEIGGAFGGKIR
ncbi:MAG: xanthine dehydrogenase family protein molybdopterin-binding subunit, partial [Chloroflexi bacterium]|nr:xanthine dehydrogenase family protein molybdopterin-binding subunit [Chloroflexota bacterium]